MTSRENSPQSSSGASTQYKRYLEACRETPIPRHLFTQEWFERARAFYSSSLETMASSGRADETTPPTNEAEGQNNQQEETTPPTNEAEGQNNQQNDYIAQLVASEDLLNQVSGCSDETLDTLIERFNAMKLDIALKEGYIKMEKTTRVKAQSKAVAKAKAKAKALATAQALAQKKEGMVPITAMTKPDDTVVRFSISKGKTIGKIRSRILRLSGSFPTVGKKNGIHKRDILIVDEHGNIMADRKYIYNVEGLENGGRFVAIQRSNFIPATFVFPDFPEEDADEEIDEDDDEDDSDEDED